MSRALVLVPLALSTALLTGCSSGSADTPVAASPVATPSATPEPFEGQSPGRIYDTAVYEMTQATSVHVVGTIRDGGDELELDLALSDSFGGQATGSITIGGAEVDVRRTGDTMFFKGEKRFWTSQGGVDAGTAAQLAGRWIKTSTSDPSLAEFAELTDTRGPVAFGALSLTKAEGDRLKRVPGRDVGGQATVGLADRRSAKKGVLYVSTGAKGRPLLQTGPGDQELTWSDWNERVKVTAPKGALDLTG